MLWRPVRSSAWSLPLRSSRWRRPTTRISARRTAPTVATGYQHSQTTPSPWRSRRRHLRFCRLRPYGNEIEDAYLDWLLGFARALRPKLADDGSFVIDMGGAYQRGTPSRTLVQWKFLIRVVEELGYSLAQECYWYNPSKLPTPFEWVNKRKLRLKDPVNTVWWFGKTDWPKADTTRVLTPYSARMKKLLVNPEGYFTASDRPSQHYVSNNFRDNGGALPSHLLTIPNSESNGAYLRACKLAGVPAHPARFPEAFRNSSSIC